MKSLLLGLILLSAPAMATPVSNCLFCFAGMDFSNYVHPVTVENTPDWAQVPHADAWYQIELGVLSGNWQGMMLVLRGLLFLEERPHLEAWLEIVPVVFGEVDNGPESAGTPEPGTWLLAAAGLGALSLRRRRNRAGAGGADRRSSSST